MNEFRAGIVYRQKYSPRAMRERRSAFQFRCGAKSVFNKIMNTSNAIGVAEHWTLNDDSRTPSFKPCLPDEITFGEAGYRLQTR